MIEVKLTTTSGTRYLQCDTEEEAHDYAEWAPSILGDFCLSAEVVA